MSNDTPTRPTLRLKPKADARRIRHGHPWVYLDDVVADRRSRAITPGTIATLEDADRTPVATVAVNMESRIAARVLSRDPDAVIDAGAIAARIKIALAHRDRLYAEPFYRLVHAEADGMPGVVIDRFGDAAVLQPNAAWADAMAEDIAEALVGLGVVHVLLNASGRARSMEGLSDDTRWLRGGVDAPIAVPMNGATYMADLTGGQKTGLFYDQRPNHAFVAGVSRGARVLDVFAHVGGFGLAALAGGAVSALAVDGSAPALGLAQDGAARMDRTADFTTRKGDAFDLMTALAEEGERFDVVVADPPAFAPAKPALTAGLRAYERVARLAAPLVAPGGYLTLCSCSHAAELSKFRASSIRGIGRAAREAQLIHTGFAGPDHPVHPQLAESGYLKTLTFRMLD
ncbi:RSP_2647 family RNA methyltransferase [Jannaschia donghaensis]|uniref:Ribosomal RNA large subunit methyltransferase I n=1 Tax=Jannaschia donghaensis TaxID=420998 RepID=A0A0M6YGE6_9RHOB|nr:class I SAM-dependent rRNA methyltransferase [Jannaschia donghaensis]CTQ48755.1 Ribosomal RNA large subunit methyltransferase I [Jannaschia donghaensis]